MLFCIIYYVTFYYRDKEEGPEVKRPKMEDLAGGIESMTKAKVTEVCTFCSVFFLFLFLFVC